MKLLGIIVGLIGCVFGGYLFCYLFYYGIIDMFNAIKMGNAEMFVKGLAFWWLKELGASLIIAVSVVSGMLIASLEK
jgi:hypothetical protein